MTLEIINQSNGIAALTAPSTEIRASQGQDNVEKRVFNVAITTFKEGDLIDLSQWVPIHVTSENGNKSVLVYADIDDLASRLGLTSKDELANNISNDANYVEKKIEEQLNQKEEFKDLELTPKTVFVAVGQEEKLTLDEAQVKKIYANFFGFEFEEDEVSADKGLSKAVKEVTEHAEKLREKIQHNHPELNDPKYETALKMASLLLAHKNFHDAPYNNKSFAMLFGISTPKLNELELAFLKGIDWNTDIIK